MDDPIKDCCGWCKAFSTRKEVDGINIGFCLFNPPYICSIEVPKTTNGIVGKVTEIVSHWPSVRETDYCRKFEPGEDQTLKTKTGKDGGYY